MRYYTFLVRDKYISTDPYLMMYFARCKEPIVTVWFNRERYLLCINIINNQFSAIRLSKLYSIHTSDEAPTKRNGYEHHVVADCGDYEFDITEGVGTFDYTITHKRSNNEIC